MLARTNLLQYVSTQGVLRIDECVIGGKVVYNVYFDDRGVATCTSYEAARNVWDRVREALCES